MQTERAQPISPRGVPGDDHIWFAVRDAGAWTGRDRPALFLDRDGVVNVDHGYAHRLDDLDVIDGAAGLIAAANVRDIAVIVVTNQSGVGRGYYDWSQFAAFQTAIEERLATHGAAIDAAFACPFHAEGRPPYDIADHPSRKPAPGMLIQGAEALSIDLAASWIIGDRPGDVAAGHAAGLAGGVLIGGQAPAFDPPFIIRTAASTAAARHCLPWFGG